MDTNPVIGVTLLCQGTPRRPASLVGPRLLLQGSAACLGLEANSVDPHVASVTAGASPAHCGCVT